MKWLFAGLLALAVVLGACGDDSDPDSSDPEGLPTNAPTSSAPTTPTSSLPVESDGNAPGIPPLAGPPTTTASGLQYIDEVVGAGPTAPTPTTCVTVHYTGWLTDGTQFDSSAGGAPVSFSLAGVIDGWSEGVGSMNEGGKRRLIIPGELGYGPTGYPAAGIPGDATLIFDVELISIGGEPTPDPAGRPVCPQ